MYHYGFRDTSEMMNRKNNDRTPKYEEQTQFIQRYFGCQKPGCETDFGDEHCLFRSGFQKVQYII